MWLGAFLILSPLWLVSLVIKGEVDLDCVNTLKKVSTIEHKLGENQNN